MDLAMLAQEAHAAVAKAAGLTELGESHLVRYQCLFIGATSSSLHENDGAAAAAIRWSQS